MKLPELLHLLLLTGWQVGLLHLTLKKAKVKRDMFESLTHLLSEDSFNLVLKLTSQSFDCLLLTQFPRLKASWCQVYFKWSSSQLVRIISSQSDSMFFSRTKFEE